MRRHAVVTFLAGATALIAALTEADEMAFAQSDTISANYIMPDCRAFLGPALQQGRCSGIVEGLVFADKGVCAPRSSTTEQAVRIVVQYIEKWPAKLNQNFVTLAHDALKAAWPCGHQGSQGAAQRGRPSVQFRQED